MGYTQSPGLSRNRGERFCKQALQAAVVPLSRSVLESAGAVYRVLNEGGTRCAWSMIPCMRTAFLFAAMVLPATSAGLPDFYKNVDRVVWVVRDVRATAAAWEKAGWGPVEILDDAGGASLAIAKLPNVEIDWIQPLTKDAMADFLERHGEGVFSLMHRVPSLDAMKAEVSRLGALGVEVLMRGTTGGYDYVFFDTEREGKYVLGLLTGPDGGRPAGNGPAVTQFAFVSHDTHAASAFWAKLGWPEMTYTHGTMSDLEYRGSPGKFDQELGWQRHGEVPYEWIKPLKSPTVYEDYIKAHGESFHHLAVNVPDMDEAIAAWEKAGYKVEQSGAWGDAGKPGSGRFAYIETEGVGGIAIELLWNYKE